MRPLFAAVLVAIAFALPACDDSSTEPEPNEALEDELQRMKLHDACVDAQGCTDSMCASEYGAVFDCEGDETRTECTDEIVALLDCGADQCGEVECSDGGCEAAMVQGHCESLECARGECTPKDDACNDLTSSSKPEFRDCYPAS